MIEMYFLQLSHMKDSATTMEEESKKRVNFLCLLDSIMLGYQVDMLFMIK